MNKYLIITNCGSEKEAQKIAKILIKNKMAACVNIIPKIRSIYRWQNKIHDETEFMLLIKTTKNKYKSLEKIIKSNHSYEVPEIIAFEIKAGLKSYLKWIEEMVNI